MFSDSPQHIYLELKILLNQNVNYLVNYCENISVRNYNLNGRDSTKPLTTEEMSGKKL